MENEGIIDDSSDIEDVDDLGTEVELYEEEFERLKKHDPTIANLNITLNCYDDWGFNKIDWKKDGNCISDNIHLKKLTIFYLSGDKSQYILGQEGHAVPTRQQLKDFFSCIHRNRSIKEICINQIRINNQFSWDLIHGLHGHPSITRLQIYHVDSRDIGLEQLRKALSHPQSKLTGLRLICSLEDGGLGVVCDALLGSTLKSLCLNGNYKITLAGWRALSTVMKHPNCKLVKLDLSFTQIDDDGVNLLGNALSCSSVKILNLSSNKKYISSAGWQSLLNQLSLSQNITSLDLSSNNIEDGNLLELANIGTLKSLDLGRNHTITPSGWRLFFDSLQMRGTQLKKLDIYGSKIGDTCIQALGSLLSSMNTLKELSMSGISHLDSTGWVSLFNSLQDSNLDLEELSLCGTSIDNDGIQLLVPLVSRMSSLTHLYLGSNRLITPAGWQELIGYLQSPNFALEELRLHCNIIDDDIVISFARVLDHNETLKSLTLEDCYEYYLPDDFDEDEDELNYNYLINKRGWDAVSSLLCNKTSIVDTYNSNHTLHYAGRHNDMNLPDDLLSYLEVNKNKDKAEVARQKILQSHFSTVDNLQEFLDMELEIMPIAIAWIGRPVAIHWSGMNMSGLSTMYDLMKRLPDLFDSGAAKKKSIARGSVICS